MIFGFALSADLDTLLARRRPREDVQQELPRFASQRIRLQSSAKDPLLRFLHVDHTSILVERRLPLLHGDRLATGHVGCLLEINLNSCETVSCEMAEIEASTDFVDHFETVVVRFS